MFLPLGKIFGYCGLLISPELNAGVTKLLVFLSSLYIKNIKKLLLCNFCVHRLTDILSFGRTKCDSLDWPFLRL